MRVPVVVARLPLERVKSVHGERPNRAADLLLPLLSSRRANRNGTDKICHLSWRCRCHYCRHCRGPSRWRPEMVVQQTVVGPPNGRHEIAQTRRVLGFDRRRSRRREARHGRQPGWPCKPICCCRRRRHSRVIVSTVGIVTIDVAIEILVGAIFVAEAGVLDNFLISCGRNLQLTEDLTRLWSGRVNCERAAEHRGQRESSPDGISEAQPGPAAARLTAEGARWAGRVACGLEALIAFIFVCCICAASFSRAPS